MRKLRLYLDTSVISHLFHEDVPDRQETTEQFLEGAVLSGVYEAWVSFVVLGELRRTRDSEKRTMLLSAIAEFNIGVIQPDERLGEIRSLAAHYLSRGIVSRQHRRDALHVAVATVHHMDAVVSWNFRPLVNLTKETHFHAANIEAGYFKPLRIVSPQEVLHEEES